MDGDWRIHDDVIEWKHFPRNWPFVRGIHRSPVNFPHKGQWRGALMFSLIWVWINDWVNNREAGDLRRYRAHYEVTVMPLCDRATSSRWLQMSSQHDDCRCNRRQAICSRHADAIIPILLRVILHDTYIMFQSLHKQGPGQIGRSTTHHFLCYLRVNLFKVITRNVILYAETRSHVDEVGVNSLWPSDAIWRHRLGQQVNIGPGFGLLPDGI